MKNRNGFVLEATLFVLVLMSVLMLSVYTGAAMSTRSANLDYRTSRVSYAAEAGADAIMAQLADALEDGYLADDELYGITPPDLAGFTFSMLAEKIGDVEVETVTDGPFAGLYSLTQKLQITSNAVDLMGNTSAVIVSAKARAFPVFQFGMFFEGDLEATNGPSMTFSGWVHSNGNIYLSSNNAWYKNRMTTPNKIYHDRKDFHDVKNGVWIANASAVDVMLLFDSRTHSIPAAFRAESDLQFDNRLMTDAYGVDSLALPLPPGVEAYELLLPKEASDTPQEREAKFAWRADMSVRVDLTDIRTNGAVCGIKQASKFPDEVIGNPGVSGLQPVVPGQQTNFKVGPDCGGTSTWSVEVRADGVTIYQNANLSSCTFQVTIPIGTDEIEVIITANATDPGTTPYAGTAKWTGLQSIGSFDPAPYPTITVTRSGGFTAPTPSEMCNMIRFNWSAFYEGREDAVMDMLEVDIGFLGIWIDGDPLKKTSVFYFEFVVPDATLPGWTAAEKAMLSDATLDPAVRLKNGINLPNPLTMATHYPLYVMGDYNKQAWKPAAFVGDAITILSNAWDDGQHQAQVLVKPNATATEVYGAILAGHSATPCDHEDAGCAGGYEDFYGGGIENFPRFLETWSGITLKYVGALVSIHESVISNSTWNGTYYSPPVRDWSFDTRFKDPTNLPPGTPVVGDVIHTAFRPVY